MMPPNAKQVFKGIMFEVWQWEQIMYDGSIEVFEKIKRANNTGVIALVGDKILLQLQEQPDKPEPFTSLPGGRCNDDEDFLDGAKRELLEETGYASDNWKLWYEYEPSAKMEWTIRIYIAKDCKQIAQPHLDAGEKIQNRFVSFEEFMMLSEDATFRDQDMVEMLLRARLDKQKEEEIRKLFFG